MLEINPAAGSLEAKASYTGRIEIIEKLSGQYWKVKAGLKELKVSAGIDLKPGDIVLGKIAARGNSLYLTLLKRQEGSEVHPVFFIEKSSIDHLVRMIFQETGSKPDKVLTAILKSLAARKEIASGHDAVLAGEAYRKGFRSESSISALIAAVSGEGEKGSGRHSPGGGHGRDDRDRTKEDLFDAVMKAEGSGNALFAFNHLSCDNRHWIIIPYATGDEKNLLKGSLRLKTVNNLLEAIVVHAEKNNSLWFFSITGMRDPVRHMKIYADKNGTKALKVKKIALFMKKLQNLGVEIDDNIYDLDTFNGFSAIERSSGIDVKV